MNLQFTPQLFLRAAGKTFEKFDYNNLPALIQSHAFQAAIYLASESLYTELEKCEFNYEKLARIAKFSLQKYYNRLCFRATPFGLFAAVSVINWEEYNSSPMIADQPHVHITADFQLMIKLGRELLKYHSNDLKFFANRTIYKVASKYRYLKNDNEENDKPGSFKIYSFEHNPLLGKLLKYCELGRSVSELVNFCVKNGADNDEAHVFVNELINAEIFCSEVAPHHVGESYIVKLNEFFESCNVGFNEKSKWRELYKLLSISYTPADIPLTKFINMQWPFINEPIKSKFYANTFLKFASCISSRYQEQILEGLECLNKITFYEDSQELQRFKERFRKRFEDQEVPLLIALDPELGIGYLDLGQSIEESSILEDVNFIPPITGNPIRWGAVHKLFLQKIYQTNAYDPIELDDKDLAELDSIEQAFPPSFSIMFNICDNYINIEHAGGCSGAALTGRFTLFDDDVKAYVQQIARAEQLINNEVVFAEVSCLINEHSANINTRDSAYKYEIPLLLSSPLTSEQQLSLNDLYVSVIDNEIILRSKKLNKIIIPRFSSVYNYNRHDLSLFRFLCDLQSQSIKKDLDFNFSRLLPGLKFYPRVIYKSCIINKATWYLDELQLKKVINSPEQELACKKLLVELSIPQFFIIADHDNSLLFDQNDSNAIKLFLQVIKNKTSVTLKEVLSSSNSLVNDSAGGPLINEFVACIINYTPAYKNVAGSYKSKSFNQIQRTYVPGEDWLYLKVYAVSHVLEDFIGNELYHFIGKLTKNQMLVQWFFIRYKDPDVHLRIRVKMNHDDISDILSVFNSILKERRQNGSISNFQLDTYNRELERYGGANIFLIENIFQASSQLALRFLRLSNKDKLNFGCFEAVLVSVNEIIIEYEKDILKIIEFIERAVQQFGKEFNMNKQLKHQMNDKYRKNKSLIYNSLATPQRGIILAKLKFENMRLHLKELVNGNVLQKAITTESLFSDIIHLHVNRMVMESPRQQELIIYYMLGKYYEMLKVRTIHPSF